MVERDLFLHVLMVIKEEKMAAGSHLFEVQEVRVHQIKSASSVNANEVTSNVREVSVEVFNRPVRIAPLNV